MILDGTLLRIDRVGMRRRPTRPYLWGKHKRHGLNVQLLADQAGRMIWASPTLPGATHDLTAARTHSPVDALTDAAVTVLADRGYRGAGGATRRPATACRTSRGNSSHARFGIGATVSRYAAEVVDLLAGLGPQLSTAVRAASGKAYVILEEPSRRSTGSACWPRPTGPTTPANTSGTG